jgi:hypothetical protein
MARLMFVYSDTLIALYPGAASNTGMQTNKETIYHSARNIQVTLEQLQLTITIFISIDLTNVQVACLRYKARKLKVT